jgi:hypothetical protein
MIGVSDVALGGLFALAGVVVGGAINAFDRWRERVAARTDRRIEHQLAQRERWEQPATQALARVEEFLIDADPVRVTFNMQKATVPETLERIEAAWETLRPALTEVSVGYPSEDVHRLAKELNTALYSLKIDHAWTLSDVFRDRDWHDSHERAREHWARATAIQVELLEVIHDES